MSIIKREKGQAMTEVALTLPLFIIIIAVLVQLWFMTVRKQQTYMATRYAARAIITSKGKDGTGKTWEEGGVKSRIKTRIYNFEKTKCENDSLGNKDMVFSQKKMEPNSAIKGLISIIDLLCWVIDPLSPPQPGTPARPYKSDVEITYHQAVIGSWDVTRKIFDKADGNNDGLIDLKDKYSIAKQY